MTTNAAKLGKAFDNDDSETLYLAKQVNFSHLKLVDLYIICDYVSLCSILQICGTERRKVV